MNEALNEQSLDGWLERHPGWSARDGVLTKEYRFRSFRDAIVFVNRVASLADESKALPAIDVRGDRVRLGLSSPGPPRITERELALAERIDFATSAR